MLGERPGEVGVWTQRVDGRFGPLPTRVRLPGVPEGRFGYDLEPLLTADGRGGHVVVHGSSTFLLTGPSALLRSTRVLVTQLTPGGRAVVLAGPFAPATDIHLEPAAIAGRDLAVAWLEGGATQRVRLIQRRGSGPVVRRTLTPPGRRLYELNVALGGGRVALAGTEGGFRGNSPPSAVILGRRRTTRLELARSAGTVSAPAVVVDPRGVARFLWRDRLARLLMRVHRP